MTTLKTTISSIDEIHKASKPYGHTAYTRRTKGGKLVQVQAKGVARAAAASSIARNASVRIRADSIDHKRPEATKRQQSCTTRHISFT